MKKLVLLLIMVVYAIQIWGQYYKSDARTWDKYPPEVQLRGFSLHKSQLIQMDDDPQLEEVLLFSSDYGHYPYFDFFKIYYVIIDNYTKQVKYQSDVIITTERNLILEDRNNDGKYELYRKYFKDGAFKVNPDGNNLSVTWMYDCISFK